MNSNLTSTHPKEEKLAMDRRHFLKVSGTAGAGMSLGFFLPERAHAADTPQLNVWVEIEAKDTIVIRYARAEMGQGSMTSAPMMIAEELEADWKKVRVEYVTAHDNLRTKRAYGDMASVGSRTIRHSQEYLRKAGATAREMLVMAAAQKWNVPAGECKAALSKVTHTPTKRSFTYGQLAADAAKLEALKRFNLKILNTGPSLANLFLELTFQISSRASVNTALIPNCLVCCMLQLRLAQCSTAKSNPSMPLRLKIAAALSRS